MTVPKPSTAGWRDALLFLTGLGLIVHEAVIYEGPERWGLLALYAGMCGLPTFLRQDNKRASGTKPPAGPPDPREAEP